MKRLFLFFSLFIILIAVLLERSGMTWELERPLFHWLAKKTDHSLPEVTAVVLPTVGTILVPQDVALTIRAMLSFRPRQIVIAAPLGDLSTGPLSLIREAQAEGVVQGIPCFFGPLPEPQISRAYPGSSLFFKTTSKAVPSKIVSLDDFLLRREEMERGQIRPDLDGLFRNRTVIIGGAEAPRQAAILEDAQQQLTVQHLNSVLYGVFLFILSLGMIIITRFSGIDFLLLLFFSCCLYAIGVFLSFRFCDVLLPLVLPASLVLVAFFKKGTSSFLR